MKRLDFELNESAILYAARGIGIFLVVLAHVIPGPQNRYIYLFHMPFFFFLAGITSAHFAVWDFKSILKRLVFLFFPALFSIAFIFILIRFNPACYGLGFFSATDCARYSFGSGGFSGVFSAFWFIPAVAVCYFLFFLLRRISFVFLIPTIILLFVFLSNFMANLTFVPTLLLSSIYGFQFFLMGYFLNVDILKRYRLEFYLLAIASIIAAWRGGLSLDLAARNYGIPFLSSLIGLVFSISLVNLISFFSSIPGFLRLFSKFGRASLFILLYHQAIHLAVAHVFPWMPLIFVFFITLFTPMLMFYFLMGRSRYFSYLGVK